MIGHRGASAIAPENTVEAFRAAVTLGADLVELDVVAHPGGSLLVAHSLDLEELTHGGERGDARSLSCDELRRAAPLLCTLDEALAFFAEEATETGIMIDLKLRERLGEVAAALGRHDVADRTIVSGTSASALRTVASGAPGVLVGFTYPEDRHGINDHRLTRPLIGPGLRALRLTMPRRAQGMVRRSGADALVLNHRLVTLDVVTRVHALGAPVLAWTANEETEIRRLTEAGVDAVITDDPALAVATLAT